VIISKPLFESWSLRVFKLEGSFPFKALFIDVSAMPDPQDYDIFVQEGVDDAVIAHSIFAETCEFSLKDGIGLSLF
jgi:hypothetical protein